MTKVAAVLALIAAALGLPVSAALAHVEVQPVEAVVNEQQQFRIRVPTEGDVATQGVEVTFPDSVVVASFGGPPTGWSLEVVEDANERISGAIYRGGEIPPGQYGEFTLLATPNEVGTTVWRVEQILANGSMKLWTGPPEQPGDVRVEEPGAPGPAAAVEVVEQPTPAAVAGGSGEPAGDGDDTNDAAVWLGLIAIVLAIGALVAAGLLWTRRPMDLPPDGS
jgi:periplasmic copper chaperone A